MRSKLRAIISTLCSAFVLAAVVTTGAAGAASAQETPRYGGTFSLPISNDPAIWPIQGGIYNILVNKMVYDTLVRYDNETLDPVGSLAESWDVSDDGLAWTFHLREGVAWHDGEAFDAEDVKFSFDVWTNPDVPYYLNGNVTNVVRTEIVDRYTVRVHMSEPLSSFPVLLGYNMAILPEHLLGDYSAEELASPRAFLRHPIGTGPFEFDEKRIGSYVRLVRNDEYWAGRPYLDAVVFRIGADIDTQLAQLQAGDLDFVPIEPYQVSAVENVPGIKIENVSFVNHYYIDLNHLNPIFQDKAVRQALTYGLNRQAIVDQLLGGYGQVATGPIDPDIAWAYNPDVKQYPFDPDEANELLDEAGWERGRDGVRVKDGRRLAFTIEVDPHPVRQQMALLAQSNWEALGVDADIEILEYNVILQHARGNPPTHEANPNWLITPPDPDLSTYYMTDAGGNTSEFSHPDVDRLLVEGRQATDQEARKRAYFELQEVIAEEAPIIYLFYPAELRAVSERVHGLPQIGYRDALGWAHLIWKE